MTRKADYHKRKLWLDYVDRHKGEQKKPDDGIDELLAEFGARRNWMEPGGIGWHRTIAVGQGISGKMMRAIPSNSSISRLTTGKAM